MTKRKPSLLVSLAEDFDALVAVENALRALPPEARRRVLRAVIALLGLDEPWDPLPPTRRQRR